MPEGPGGNIYRLDGPEGAPVLVLAGSLGTTMSVWGLQVPALSQWRRVLRFEHPGHGQAWAPEGEGSVGALGRRLVTLLDYLGVADVDFAGLSLGGLVGMWLALNHPARVRRLALCCTAASFGAREAFLERAQRVRADGTAPLVKAALGRWFSQGFLSAHPEVGTEFAGMLQGTDPDGYAYCCEAVANADFYSELATVDAPTLVLSGASDPVVTVEMAAATMKALPRASLSVLAGGAHLANVELAGAVNEALVTHFVGSSRERGDAARRAVLGDDHVEAAAARASDFSRSFQDLLALWPWGEVWARPGLAKRDRRLVTIALLAGLGRADELEMHTREALADGVTEEELKAVLLHVAAYAGAPAANLAFAVADRVVRAGPRARP